MNIQKTTRASKPPKTKSIFGFTLIELIVVITILAILGTIGFLSIGGYSSKARDSSRISDVANISKSLDVSIITVGTYPTPDNFFAVTYSGGTIWNQGVIGTTVLQSLRTSIAGGGLSKKPVDPLDNSEYEYSSLAFGKAYQIKAEYEGDLNQTAYQLSTPSLIEEAKAAPGSPTIAYIKGNYGGLMARTVTGSFTYILALPSIMTSTGTANAILRIEQANALSGTLLFNGKNLKNASAFNPNLTPVFSGSGKVLTTSAEITTLMTNLKNTYTSSGTPDVLANTNIASLIAMSTGSLTTLGSNLVKNDLGITDGGGGGNTDTTVSGVCTSLPSNAVYFNSTTSYSLTSAPMGTSLTASGVTTPTSNTCQFKCNNNYFLNGNQCVTYVPFSYGGTDYFLVNKGFSETWITSQWQYSACQAIGKRSVWGGCGDSAVLRDAAAVAIVNNSANLGNAFAVYLMDAAASATYRQVVFGASTGCTGVANGMCSRNYSSIGNYQTWCGNPGDAGYGSYTSVVNASGGAWSICAN